ncbi:MAG: hypothetical protein LUG60_05550 [Erysipelotrichaceae bacterium]|nr:hypothetical protein [Erysipelotrichaceae bacterium]
MKKVILISCFDWYEKRLKYIKNYFENKGYKVILITSNFDHKTKEKITKYKNDLTYVNVLSYKKNLSFRRLLSHYIFSIKIAKIIKKENPDLVYSLVPPNSIVKNISLLKKKMDFILIYDVIDLWPESFPMNAFFYILF